MVQDARCLRVHGVSHEKLPGRLKAIVLSETLSVAYAGDATLALNVIRAAEQMLMNNASPRDCVDYLGQMAQEASGLFEFLIASHLPDAVLRKAGIAGLSAPISGGAIGDLRVLDVIPDYAGEAGADEFDEYGCAAEHRIATAFQRLFSAPHVALPETVGGLPIVLLGSPFGHSYVRHSSAFTWDTIDLGIGVTELQRSNQLSGMTSWRYSISCPERRGLGIVSVYLPQLAAGYVFNPLRYERPRLQRDVQQSVFEHEIIALTDIDENKKPT